MAAIETHLFPLPSKETLERTFIGKKLNDVSTPAAVLDRAVVQRNCKQMLDACKALEVGFRPHVKTHKVGLCLSTSSVLYGGPSESGLVIFHVRSKPTVL